MASLVTALLCSALGVFWGRTHYENTVSADAEVYLGVLAFFVGHVVSEAILAVVSSGVTAVYVSYIQIPQELMRNHPEAFARLDDAWKVKFPHIGEGEQEPLRRGS